MTTENVDSSGPLNPLELSELLSEDEREEALDQIRAAINSVDKNLIETLETRWVLAVAAFRRKPERARIGDDDWESRLINKAHATRETVMQDIMKQRHEPYAHEIELEELVTSFYQWAMPIFSAQTREKMDLRSEGYSYIDEIFSPGTEKTEPEARKTLGSLIMRGVSRFTHREQEGLRQDNQEDIDAASEEEDKAELTKVLTTNDEEVIILLARRLELTLQACLYKKNQEDTRDPAREQAILERIEGNFSNTVIASESIHAHITKIYRALLIEMPRYQGEYLEPMRPVKKEEN